jgi:hypothetical protein
MLQAMCLRWNRPPFRLHFACAREAYNIVKAAEAGLAGNPNDYRDFLISPPANRRIHCNRPWRLVRYEPGCIQLQILDPGLAEIQFAPDPLLWVRGTIKRLGAEFVGNQIKSLDIDGSGDYEVKVSPQCPGAPGRRLPKAAVEQLLASGRGG